VTEGDLTPAEGVVYVATKDDRFVEEAVLSAATLKRQAPGLPAWLYTDRTDCALARLDVFDRVVAIESCDDYEDASAGAKIDRLRVLADPPFARCLQIDTDTRILSPRIAEAFGFLEAVDIAMVECHPDGSISRGLYGRPMFNGGFILFRRNAKTAALFEAWRDLSDRHFRLADRADLTGVAADCPYLAHVPEGEDRRTLLRRDQLALAQLFSPETNRFDLDYAQLSEGWNFRGAGKHRKLMEPVIVDHRNAYKLRTTQDLLALAYARFAAGDRKAASLVYNHVLARHAPELAEAPAAALIHGFKTAENGAFAAIGEAAAAALAAAPGEAAPQWLASALRMAALHLRAGQKEPALKLGEAIRERVE